MQIHRQSLARQSRARQSRAHWSAVALSVLAMSVSLVLGSGRAAATVPPTDPTTPPASTDTLAPAPTDVPVELVQSWTLTPGGSANGDEIGTRPNLTYQLAPGAVATDTVIVYNLGNVPLDFRVYATDAFNNADGEFDLLPGEQPPVDAGSWVTFAQSGITLPPGKQATIPVTITVPPDATPGDHVGAIVASNVVVNDNGGGQVVNVDRRTGTRLYIQVDGPLTPELAITDLQTEYHHELNSLSGSADISFRIENRGNVRLQGTPKFSMAGPLGLGKQTVTLPEVSELLPGQHVDLKASLAGVPALFLDSTEVSIIPTGAAAADAGAAKGSDTTFAPPITVLLVAIALLCGWMALRAYRRHRRAAVGAPTTGTLPASQQPDADRVIVLEPQHQ